MSSDIAVSVRGLSKAYNIVHNTEQHVTLAEAMLSRLKHPFRRMERETFWALKDINFDIRRGDVVGIIGRNGAGKSTLLKVLSRITEPTRGEIDIYGRIGSLLEVGTGFHPELTGRENIYLNGAILGMRRREITRQFDAIVDFAGVEKFLDTPVKRYSSGMYVRLAFAVAAHLNPEILIVDEVLAVGDAEFQKKCLGKMEDVASQGRTVLFVSHNMAIIKSLCKKGILLNNGSIAALGSIEEVVSEYLKTMEKKAAGSLLTRSDRRGKGDVKLAELNIRSGGDFTSSTLTTGGPVVFEFVLSEPFSNLRVSFTIYDQNGLPVCNLDNSKISGNDIYQEDRPKTITCNVDSLVLIPGRYRANVALWHGHDLQDHIEAAAYFEVDPGELNGRPVEPGLGYGSVHLPHSWIYGAVLERVAR